MKTGEFISDLYVSVVTIPAFWQYRSQYLSFTWNNQLLLDTFFAKLFQFKIALSGAHSRLGSTTVQRTHRLKKLFKHEGYSGRHLRNDIALLQLERPISASAKVNTVCLPESRSRIPAGTQCYITGNWDLRVALIFSYTTKPGVFKFNRIIPKNL